MLDWQLIRSLADAVNERYARVREGARQCAKSPHFNGLSLPLDQLFKNEALQGRVRFHEDWDVLDLRKAYTEQKFQDFRTGDIAYNVGEGAANPISITYQIDAEIEEHRFRFTNQSARDRHLPKALHEAQRLKRRLKRLEKVRMAADRKLVEGRLCQCRQEALWRMEHRAGVIESKLWLHDQSHGRKRKERTRAIQAGNVEALARLDYPDAPREWQFQVAKRYRSSLRHKLRVLGPIVLSPSTDAAEIALKAALISARLNIFDDYEHLTQAIRDYLNVPTDAALQIMQKARRLYIGDFSHLSFGSYLKRIAWSVSREDFQSHEVHVAPERLDALSTDRDNRASRGEQIPFEGHPWSDGRRALLARLAEEFDVPIHQAREYHRKGKLKAHECEQREEVTATGAKVRGRLEVSPSEQKRWEGLLINYWDMRLRKKETKGAPAGEKKGLYRSARTTGGQRDKLREHFRREMAQLIGQNNRCD